jgi:hypothetical protein
MPKDVHDTAKALQREGYSESSAWATAWWRHNRRLKARKRKKEK